MLIRKTVFSTLLILVVAFSMLVSGCALKPSQPQAATPVPANKNIILATTTSTLDSGLLDELLPAFEKKTGYQVKTISVGTGQALAMGEKGEPDVLLVHAPEAEKKVVDSGDAINRRLVMHNDFILVGPEDDPAEVKNLKTTVAALTKIAETQQIFFSRGDESGTHKMEKSFWQKAGITPVGSWYQATGAGMGQTLNIASERKGYTLTDRASYLARKKNLALDIIIEKEAALLNIYHVMEVNAEKFPAVNRDGAKAFADFIVSNEGQAIIHDFGVGKYGQPLFVPDAGKKIEDLAK